MGADQDSTKKVIQYILLFVVVAAVVTIVVFAINHMTKLPEKIGGIEASMNTAVLKQYDNNTARGRDIIALIDANAEGNFGVIVRTKKNPEGKNYIRPLVSDPGSVEEGDDDTKADGAVDSGFSPEEDDSYLKGYFKYENENIRFNNKKGITKSGSKDQVLDNNKYDCLLIKDSDTIVGVLCTEQGVGN